MLNGLKADHNIKLLLKGLSQLRRRLLRIPNIPIVLAKEVHAFAGVKFFSLFDRTGRDVDTNDRSRTGIFENDTPIADTAGQVEDALPFDEASCVGVALLMKPQGFFLKLSSRLGVSKRHSLEGIVHNLSIYLGSVQLTFI